MGVNRKLSWLPVAFYFNISKLLYRRDRTLWVYGALAGNKYDDNAKYLYEYVNAHYSDRVRSVWLAANENVVAEARKSGGEAYTFTSSKGKEVARKAGVAIYTHALDDFGACPHVGGAKLVFLGHGVGFKQTYNAKRHGVGLWLKGLSDRVFSWIQRDITIATSEYNKAERKKIAGLSDDSHIFITGQPRNDIINLPIDRKKLYQNIGVETTKKIVLYMPTYRNSSGGQDIMETMIRALYESRELRNRLKADNLVFVVKLHPLTPQINLERRDDFIVLGYQAVKSIQELQCVSDVLITDYSSCCVDFALTGKPVVFYLPDEEWFTHHSEQVSEEFHWVSNKNRCTTPEDLAECIAQRSLAATEAINELFEDLSIKGTCYSENVYRVINSHE